MRTLLWMIEPALDLHAQREAESCPDVTWLRSVDAARRDRADREATKAALQRNTQGR